jgi:hypothetical protein
MLVELFVDSLPSRVFLRESPVFLPPQKSTEHFPIPILPGIEDHLKIIHVNNDVILVTTWLLLFIYKAG